MQRRIATLETEVASLREAIAGLVEAIGEQPAAKNSNGPRKMCPHCGEVPNYYLHTRSCKGKKQAQAI